MNIFPDQIEPSQMYKLLIGGVSPRPIAWVSSISNNGLVNLAPFSFFTVASANPAILCFNPMYTQSANEKDTLRNIREQGEFVINTVGFSDLARMNKTCQELAPEVDEFAYADIPKAASQMVKPPRVADAIVSFECRLNQIIDLGSAPLSGHLVLGDVVCVAVSDHAIDDFRIAPDTLDAIGRMAGNDYARTRDRVQLER